MRRLKMFVVVTFMAIVTSILSGCVAKMTIPQVQEGRFDFSVTYEIDGEEQTYSGTYVCKFDGAYVSLVGGGRDWTGYLEEGNGMPELAIQTNDDGVIYIGLGFYPEYFMADPDYADSSIPEPTLYIIYHSDDPDMVSIDRELDFMAEYGVRLISYTYAQPIENRYEEKWTNGRFDFSIN